MPYRSIPGGQRRYSYLLPYSRPRANHQAQTTSTSTSTVVRKWSDPVLLPYHIKRSSTQGNGLYSNAPLKRISDFERITFPSIDIR
ncbi:uncharacterized protein L199_004704 [Kwoniella botswanensis]|uniref:uncharacterized protein n=1 Tax=Kwoniella botswanensis TaxID=1268659 RepID=UPI00315DBC88